ncbi:MAG: SurA N-terminal domain-containing protein [Bacteroidetes bacterium]|nr:SurA N-terminal domain-containing protein [Bacteroidota bacterium]
MAVIGKLRSYNYLIVLAIAVALILFLMMDIIPNFNLKSQEDASNVGYINGTKISQQEFQTEFDKQEKILQAQNPNEPVSDQQQHYLRNQLWAQMSSKIINSKVFEKLGLQVVSAEMLELMMGANADQNIKSAPAFKNEMGMFDPSRVEMYVKNLDNDDPGTPPGSKRAQWVNFEKALVEQRMKQKFESLISKAAYVPKWQAEVELGNQTKSFDMNYVLIPYTALKDKEVKPTDDELNAYLKEHAAKFRQFKDTRKLRFATFDIIPSSKDSQDILAKIIEFKSEFEKATNDSLFLKANSYNGYDGIFFKKDEIQSAVTDQLFSLPLGSFIGPYIDGENYSVAKVLDRRNVSDSVRVSVITIPTNDIKTEADKIRKINLIDSLFKAADTLKLDFGMLAMMNSSDKESAAKGGDIGWINRNSNQWNPEIFNRGSVGKIYKSFSNTDAKIVKITAYPGTIPAVKFGVVSVPLIASKETEKYIYGRASELAGKSKDLKTMNEAAQKNGIVISEAEFGTEDFSINGLTENCRETIKWAFKNDINTVSPVQSLGSKKYIVACVAGSKTKGIPSLEQVRTELEAEYVREYKLKQIIEKVGEVKTLADASKVFGNMPATAGGISLSSPSVNGSYEPAVAGSLYNVKLNEVSKPIKGFSGVYYVQPTRVGEASKLASADLNVLKLQLISKVKYKQNILESLMNTAEIKDNRLSNF